MSRPTHTVKADLNGTGVLVDITASVSLSAGVTHQYGRTDWTAAETSPGTITLTIENFDGRFTPGNVKTYKVGCREGVLIEWTASTRVRRFTMGTPVLSFPDGVAGTSIVTVTCTDALGALSARTMRPMIDETVLDGKPYAYYVLDESGQDLEPNPQDSSGFGALPMVPFGDPAGFGWASGGGPPCNDSRSGLYMWGNATSAPPVPATVIEGTGTGLTAGIVPPEGGFVTSIIGGSPPLDTAVQHSMSVSAWVTVRDIYDMTNPSGQTDGGMYVALFGLRIDRGPSYAKSGIHLLWRPRDRRLKMAVTGDGGFANVITGGNISSVTGALTMSPEVTHLVTFVVSTTTNVAGSESFSVAASVDGGASVYLGNELSVPAGTPRQPDWVDANYLDVGWAPYQFMWGNSAQTLQVPVRSWAGTICRVAFFAGRPAGVFPTAQTSAPELALLGLSGGSELPSARVARIGKHLGQAALTFPAQGTQQTEPLVWQDTGSGSMLTAITNAMAGEGGSIDCATVAGVQQVRLWMDSTQRPGDATFSVSVDVDASGVPDVSFDTSGVTNQVAAASRAVAALWVDREAPAHWQGPEASIEGAYGTSEWITGLAQYRSLWGRTNKMTLAAVTVDIANATTDLLAALLALRPGIRITVTGLPKAVIGYDTVDCFVIGCTEAHTVGESAFTLSLQPCPDDGEAYTDPEDGSLSEDFYRLKDDGEFMVLSAMSAFSSSTMVLTVTDLTALPMSWTRDAADYPMVIQIDSEQIQLTAPPGVSLNWASTALVRGYNGTIAAAHAYMAAVHIIGDGDLLAAF